MTTPATFNITMTRGDSYDLFFRVKARDAGGTLVYQNLTGATVTAQYRETVDSVSALASFVATLSDQGTMPGGVLLHLSPATTAALTQLTGVWDCQIAYSADDVKTVLSGTVTVNKDVTRA